MKAIKTILASLAFLAPVAASAQFNLGNLLSSGLQALQNATATTNFDAQDLVGTWDYVSPAVSFKGNSGLANIGGAAASAVVEQKLAPYYKKAGLDSSHLVVNPDLSFTWSCGKITLAGTIEKSSDSDLVFNFAAFGKVSIGRVNCIATKSGSIVSLTFDSSKLLSVAQKISSVASSSTFKTVDSILSSYKDMYLGVKLQKSN